MYRIFGEFFPMTTVYAVLAFIGLLLLFLKLRTVLFLTLVALLLPSLNTPLYDVSRLLRWAFLGALLAKGVLSNVRQGLRPRPFTSAHAAITVLAAMVLASATYSIGPEVTLAQGAAMLILWAVVLLVLWNAWASEDEIFVVCNSLYRLACLLFVAEFSYLVFGLGEVMGTARRYAGVFANPNGLGTAVAFLGPFVYWKHRTTASPAVRMWVKILGLFMAFSLWQSGSRSGLLGSVVCLGFMAAYIYRVRLFVAGAVVALPLALFIVLGPQLDPDVLADSHLIRAETLSDLGDRLPDWKKGFDLFLERPMLGYGYGMSKFAELGRADFDLAVAVYKLRGANYHNAHLQMALDLGVAGLAVFWWFFLTVLARGLGLYLRGTRSALDLAGIAFYAAFLAMAGDTFVHGWAFSPGSSLAIVFWLLASAVLRVVCLARRQAAAAEGPPPETLELSAPVTAGAG